MNLTSAIAEARNAGTHPGAMQRVKQAVRGVVLDRLRHIQGGRVTVHEGFETQIIGQAGLNADLMASIRVHDPALYTRVLTRGALGAAESYMEGQWDSDDLTSLLRIMVRNNDALHEFNRGWGRLAKSIQRVGHWLRANTRSGSRQNIHAHYDLGNDFFSLFLDETLNYSCAVFETSAVTLRDAAVAKMDRACRKLRLKSTDHLLEIGTGWGGFAIHAARNYGCRVTTTTLSQQQYEFAREKIRAEGLSDSVEVLLRDYRDLEGCFDKIVSIEMIEAVGHRNLNTYFSKCSQLLKPDGAMFLQAIAMGDRVYERYLDSVDFIQKYVFPGSCCPSLEAMLDAVRRSTDFRLFHLEDIGPHYAQTINCWRRAFHENIEHVRALGYSERFIRLWNYYLCYCEAGFAERYIGDLQMVLTKPGSRLSALPAVAQ